MDLMEFLRENLNESYDFKLTSDLSFVFEKEKDNITIRLSQGDRYVRGVIQPVTISIVTKNVSETVKVWSDFVKKTSDRNYPDGQDNYYIMFQTPYVSQVFDEVSNDFYHTVVVFGTIVVTEGILDIEKIKIDGVDIELNEAVYQLVNNPSSEQLSEDGWLNVTEIQNTIITLQLVTFLVDYGVLGTKLRRQRRGQLSPNVDFSIEITFVDGDVENHTMKLISQSISKTRGAMSLLSLNFSR